MTGCKCSLNEPMVRGTLLRYNLDFANRLGTLKAESDGKYLNEARPMSSNADASTSKMRLCNRGCSVNDLARRP